MIRVSALSRNYIRVSVVHRRRPTTAPPLTDDIVEFAFTENPAEGAWFPGTWETVAGVDYARVLVGPGGVTTLTRGVRPVMLRIGDNPERPVLRAGHVLVF